jgi:hypothetical protein
MVTPLLHRLLATNCSESYDILPRLFTFCEMPPNALYGLANSERDSVALVNRVVPSNPGTLKYGFGSS